MEQQHPKFYHNFKLTFVWDKLVDCLLKDNGSQSVELLAMKHLTKKLVSERKISKKIKKNFIEAWQFLQRTSNKQLAYFSTHQELIITTAMKKTLRTLEPWYRLHSQYDLQNECSFALNGINEAQFFIKGPGAWTGLHLEDCGLCSFNINFGPGTSRWTFIPYSEHLKISMALIKEMKYEPTFDIRSCWHFVYLSVEFLNKYHIVFETVLQEPKTAIFVPSDSLHQVVNDNAGINVAWNLAPFTKDTLKNMMWGYELDMFIIKKVPVVPVLRILHYVLVNYRKKLDNNELVNIGKFLVKHIKIEDDSHKCLLKYLKDNSIEYKEIRKNHLENNNCNECMRSFYLKLYIVSTPHSDIYMCSNCAFKTPSVTAVICVNLLWFDGFSDYIINVMLDSKNNCKNLDIDPVWRYPDQDEGTLLQLDDYIKSKNILEIVQSTNKKIYIEQRFDKTREKIDSLAKTVNNFEILAENVRLPKKLIKKRRALEYYEVHKNK